MIDLGRILAAASEVEAFCRAQDWRFCFIGGLAVQRWGMPRFTQDVDLTLLADWGNEPAVAGHLLKRFEARFPNPLEFAVQHRVILLRTSENIEIDCALGGLPFEERAVARASSWRPIPSVTLTTCSAEDLIVHKVFAGRDRDWADIETILARQFDRLDLPLIRQEVVELLALKDDSESIARLERLITKVSNRLTD